MGPGGRMPRGDGRKAKNVGKTLKRILSYVGKEYKFHIIVVFICIIICNVKYFLRGHALLFF